MSKNNLTPRPGKPYPLGATVTTSGVNFSLFSLNATQVELLLFDAIDARQPSASFQLNPQVNRTFYYWHAFIPGLQAGQLYGYRVAGPYDPAAGLRYDVSKLLVDPYARAVITDQYSRSDAKQFERDNLATGIKSVVVDHTVYDWEGDEPLRRLDSESLIYEMHVRGFTRHPSSGVPAEKRGTYAGLIEKIPYLQELGIRAVELMPVHQFDPQSAPPPLSNYWGYQPIAYFAPHREFSSRRDALGPVDEFRDMVKALHKAGIEVIIDVVYNHTAEEDQFGPTLCYRGLENTTYYMLDPQNPAEYLNFSATGNTLNANISVVRRLILDSLRYWVEHMHVDGFRFDLASVLSRGIDGELHPDPPILWAIESDPVLAGSKIIAEAWDAAGLYQVHNFVGLRWSVWNGQFRDTVRRFVKSDAGMNRALSDALAGSPDLFKKPQRDPVRSINYITAHDGFTLNDLVSYSQKHNQANGYNNRDGSDLNFSWNCGSEGSAADLAVAELRARQVKNFFTILLLSQGRPMFVMGDEVRRTQRGNNNPFDQDNEISWFDWDAVTQQADLLRFVRGLIGFRQSSSLFSNRSIEPVDEWNALQPSGQVAASPPKNHKQPLIRWHGVRPDKPDWRKDSHSLAFELVDRNGAERIYVMLNAFWKPMEFDLPRLAAGQAGALRQAWVRLLDTSLAAPQDFSLPGVKIPLPNNRYRLAARSCAAWLVDGLVNSPDEEEIVNAKS